MSVSKQSNTNNVPETNQCVFKINIFYNLIYYLVHMGEKTEISNNAPTCFIRVTVCPLSPPDGSFF